ncbi:MAG: hypothetical protein EHM35_00250 [Planctomycetaceae bacterium]|nr:MAG: hypothetical protein EHM35_00250 [Planctomycetaceae bacterium]
MANPEDMTPEEKKVYLLEMQCFDYETAIAALQAELERAQAELAADVAAEREACALLCQRRAEALQQELDMRPSHFAAAQIAEARACAKDIRGRGQG